MYTIPFLFLGTFLNFINMSLELPFHVRATKLLAGHGIMLVGSNLLHGCFSRLLVHLLYTRPMSDVQFLNVILYLKPGLIIAIR